MNNDMPKVLIVILNYGTYDLTLKLIQTFEKRLDYENYTVMVIDNCSPNESASVLEENKGKYGYIFYANDRNSGYAAGNNIGIRYGINNGYDYTWILNNDVELRESHVLAHMISIIESEKSIGCIGPKIYNADGSICAPYCRRQSLWNMTFGIIYEKKNRKKYINTSREVYRVYGCCMLLKNCAMADVDCMDERTFLYGEEDILAERLLVKNYSTYYDSDVSITHKGSVTIQRVSSNKKKLQMKQREMSIDIYLKEYRHFSLPARWLCKCTRSIITFLR